MTSFFGSELNLILFWFENFLIILLFNNAFSMSASISFTCLVAYFNIPNLVANFTKLSCATVVE